MPAVVLVVGGTGELGGAIVRRLLEAGRPTRVLTRNPERASQWRERGAQIATGDLRDLESLRRACNGATHVITTAHAFTARDVAVDREGNRNLIDAARDARVRRFVFTSALVPDTFRAIDFFAAKFDTEDYLRGSGLPWTILRPTAFMESWGQLLGDPIVRGGTTMLFGRGDAPVNFVAIENVAEIAVMTLDDPAAVNAVIEIGGPQNLTLMQVTDLFERVAERRARRRHMPLAVMRVLSVLLRPFNPVMARQLKAAVLGASTGQPFNPGPMLARYPVRLVTLEEWARARYPRA